MSQSYPYCAIPVFSWSNNIKPQKLKIPSVRQKFKPGTSQIKICAYYLYANLLGVDIIYSASIPENPVITSKTFLLELQTVTYFKRAWQTLKNCANPTSIHTHFWQVSRINICALYIPYIPSEPTAVYLP